MLNTFVDTNHNKVPFVTQIILSLGTNDIKYFRRENGRNKCATPGNMRVFYKPLTNLIKSIRYFFGNNVKICMQSVLPMRAQYTYTCANVLNFNSLLKSICNELDCFYLDWMHLFVNEDASDYNKRMFSDFCHLNRFGYDLLHRCLKSAVDGDRYRNYHNYFH